MTRPIKQGDTVNVVWNDGSVHQNAKILHMPSDTGDLMYIEANNGNIIGINTCAASFECVILVKSGLDDVR